MSLSIQPMQWGVLPDLEEVPPLDASDLQCLEALRDVLARRGKLRALCDPSRPTGILPSVPMKS
jgi:hypothetical protein